MNRITRGIASVAAGVICVLVGGTAVASADAPSQFTTENCHTWPDGVGYGTEKTVCVKTGWRRTTQRHGLVEEDWWIRGNCGQVHKFKGVRHVSWSGLVQAEVWAWGREPCAGAHHDIAKRYDGNRVHVQTRAEVDSAFPAPNYDAVFETVIRRDGTHRDIRG